MGRSYLIHLAMIKLILIFLNQLDKCHEVVRLEIEIEILALDIIANSTSQIFTISIFLLFQIKSVKTGTIYWSALCALSYFYMVSTTVNCVYD